MKDILPKEGMKVMRKALAEAFEDYDLVEAAGNKFYVIGESTIEFNPPILVGNPFCRVSDYAWQFEGERDDSLDLGCAEVSSHE